MRRPALVPLRSWLHVSSALLLMALSLGLSLFACDTGQDPATEIRITPESVELFIGAAQQLTAVGAGRATTWSSSSTSVATVVAQTGYVQAVGRGTAEITAKSGEAQATATVTVKAPPALALSAPALELAAVVGGTDPAARTITVSNAGDDALTGISLGAIDYGAGQATGWLTVTASGGTAPVTLTFGAHVGQLPRGTYTAVVPVLANGVANSPQFVSVTFQVQSPPSIVLSRSAVSMLGIPAVTIVETVNITNAGDVALSGLAASITYGSGAQNWLTAAINPTTAPAVLTLTGNTTGLAPGNYTATVRVASGVAGVASRDVSVALTVTPGPSIQLAATNVAANTTFGFDAPTLTVAVSNGGGGTLSGLSLGSVTYAAGQPTGWLMPSLSATTAPANVILAFNSASLAQGTYTASLPLHSTNASNTPVTLTVTLTVGPAPSIIVSRSSVPVNALPGSTAVETVSITSSGIPVTGLSTTTTYATGQPTNWLAAQLNQTTSPATLTLTASTGTLQVGTYTANVRVASTLPGVAARDVNVQLTVSPPASISISPPSVTINATVGDSPGSSAVSVTNTGGGELTGLSFGNITWTGTATNWVTPTLNQTTAPATITLSYASLGLTAGTYRASIPVLSPVATNSGVALSVTLNVQQPVMAVSPSGVSFAAWGNQSTTPGAQVINVTNSGEGTLSGLSRSISYGAGATGWLNATFNRTIAPATLTLQPNTTALNAGTYTATVTISSTQPGVASRTVSVTYTVQTWTAHVYSFLNSCASGCHSTPNTVGSSAQVYTQLSPYFSILACKLTGPNVFPCTHNGGKLGASQQAALLAWLAAGAPFR